MSGKKLPKTLFVKRVFDGDTKYFDAEEKKSLLWDDMETWTEVGEYRLIKTSQIKGTVIEK